MVETKKKTATKAKKTAVKKGTAKKAPTKKAAPKTAKKAVRKKVAEPRVIEVEAVNLKKEEKVTTSAQRVRTSTEKSLAKMEKSTGPTSYAEVNRLHKGLLSSIKGSVVVTSSQQGEGASLMAYLLAQKSAEMGSRVLLVDLNMKNHYLSHKLEKPSSIWNLLGRAQGDDLSDLISEVDSVEGLSFLSAPTDLQSVLFLKDAGRARIFLQTLEQNFDHVIIDTTPVGLLNRGNVDPVLLSSVATRTILVLLAGVTSKHVVKRAVEQLKSAGAQLEGVIVNDRDNPSLKKQLLSFVNGLKCIAPGLSDWLRYRIIHNESLD